LVYCLVKQTALVFAGMAQFAFVKNMLFISLKQAIESMLRGWPCLQ